MENLSIDSEQLESFRNMFDISMRHMMIGNNKPICGHQQIGCKFFGG